MQDVSIYRINRKWQEVMKDLANEGVLRITKAKMGDKGAPSDVEGYLLSVDAYGRMLGDKINPTTGEVTTQEIAQRSGSVAQTFTSEIARKKWLELQGEVPQENFAPVPTAQRKVQNVPARQASLAGDVVVTVEESQKKPCRSCSLPTDRVKQRRDHLGKVVLEEYLHEGDCEIEAAMRL